MWMPFTNEPVRDVRGIDLVVGILLSIVCWVVIIAVVVTVVG